MKRLTFAAFVAFWASVGTLWSVNMLAGAPAVAQAPTPAPAKTEKRIGAGELASHNTAKDCWMAIDGVVYDFSDYIPEHPTPPAVMTRWCGKEATKPYHTKGYGSPHSPEADALLPQYRIGVLVQE
jgi:cytochrome b involved in lipid metabolism